ncbi:MAG: hypothetical protein WC791_01065 [Candidatus Paceibacterota bacterium]
MLFKGEDMFDPTLITLSARFPRLYLNHFCFGVEIVFCPINSPLVAVAIIRSLSKKFEKTLFVGFTQSKEIEGLMLCADPHNFFLLPKEMRNAIAVAIESFRNDGMIIPMVLVNQEQSKECLEG